MSDGVQKVSLNVNIIDGVLVVAASPELIIQRLGLPQSKCLEQVPLDKS